MRILSFVFPSTAALLLTWRSGWACAVCFGSPDSALTQGAKAGILILLGVVGAVLAWVVGVTLYWVRRARRLQAEAAMAQYIAATPRTGPWAAPPEAGDA